MRTRIVKPQIRYSRIVSPDSVRSPTVSRMDNVFTVRHARSEACAYVSRHSYFINIQPKHLKVLLYQIYTEKRYPYQFGNSVVSSLFTHICTRIKIIMCKIHPVFQKFFANSECCIGKFYMV